MTIADIETAAGELRKSLAQPPLTLTMGGGGAGEPQHMVFDRAVMIGRDTVELLVKWLDQIQLTRAG